MTYCKLLDHRKLFVREEKHKRIVYKNTSYIIIKTNRMTSGNRNFVLTLFETVTGIDFTDFPKTLVRSDHINDTLV